MKITKFFAAVVITVIACFALPLAVGAAETWTGDATVSADETYSITDSSRGKLTVSDNVTLTVDGTATALSENLAVELGTDATLIWTATSTGTSFYGEVTITTTGTGADVSITGSSITTSTSNPALTIGTGISSVAISGSTITSNGGTAIQTASSLSIGGNSNITGTTYGVYATGGEIRIQTARIESTGTDKTENAGVYAEYGVTSLSLSGSTIETGQVSALYTVCPTTILNSNLSTAYTTGGFATEVATVNAFDELTITGNTRITSEATADKSYGICFYASGETLTIQGSAYINGTESAIWIDSSTATLEMTGGTVSGKQGILVDDAAEIDISGGTVTSTSSYLYDYASAIDVGGSTATAVSISGTSTEISADGDYADGITIANPSATLEMTGGEVSGRYGIHITAADEVDILGGTISSTSSNGDLNPAAIEIFDSSVTFSIDEISTTSTVIDGGTYGKGISIVQDSTAIFRMDDGEVSGVYGIYATSGAAIGIFGGEISSTSSSPDHAAISINGAVEVYISEDPPEMEAARALRAVVPTPILTTITGGNAQGIILDDASGTATLAMSGGSVTGLNGILAKNAGSVTITGGTVTGTGTTSSGDPYCGVYIKAGDLEINETDNDTIISAVNTNSNAYAVYFDSSAGTAMINGGTFSAFHGLGINSGEVTINGGEFTGNGTDDGYSINKIAGTLNLVPTSPETIRVKGKNSALTPATITSSDVDFYTTSTYFDGSPLTPYIVEYGDSFENNLDWRFVELFDYYPEFTVNAVNGRLYVEPGDPGSVSLERAYGDAFLALPDPAPAGQRFSHWVASGMTLLNPTAERQDLTTPYSDVTLTAVFVSTAKYTVTFDSNGGTIIPSQTVDALSTATAPEDPERHGYIFGGWFTDDETFEYRYDFTSRVKKDIDLYAKWLKTTFLVTFDSNGGTSVLPQAVVTGDAVLQPEDPVLEGYTFAGWYTDNETFVNKYDFTAPVTDSLTLYAYWTLTPITRYTVTFNSNGGTPVFPQAIESGATAILPADPGLEGYAFAGWFTDNGTFENLYTFNEPVTADITLYAYFTAIIPEPDPTFTVTFNSDGGTPVPPQTVESGATATVPATPSREGYTFDGWHFLDDLQMAVYNFSTPVTEDITLYAGWLPVAIEPEPVPTPEPAYDPIIYLPPEPPIFQFPIITINEPSVTRKDYILVVATLNKSGSVNSEETAEDVGDAHRTCESEGIPKILLEIPEPGIGVSELGMEKIFKAAGGTDIYLIFDFYDESETGESDVYGKFQLKLSEDSGLLLTGLEFGTPEIAEAQTNIIDRFEAEPLGAFSTRLRADFKGEGPARITLETARIGFTANDGKVYALIYDTREKIWYQTPAVIDDGFVTVYTNQAGIIAIITEPVN